MNQNNSNETDTRKQSLQAAGTQAAPVSAEAPRAGVPIIREQVFRDAEPLHQISPALVVLTDVEGKLRFVNDSFCDMTGYPEEELLGQDYFSLFVPERDRERLRQAYTALFLGTYEPTSGKTKRKRQPAISPLICKNGRSMEVRWYTALHVDEAGNPVGLGGFGSESPDYELQISRITDEKGLGDNILRDIGEGVVVLDQDQRVLRVSRVAEQLVGWSAAELLGKRWYEMVPFERTDGTRFEAGAVRRAMRERKRVTADYFYVRRDGTRFPVRVTASPIFDGANDGGGTPGELMGVTVVFSDMTHEKEILETQAEFVAVAAHQLRTPIASAMLQLEVLLGGTGDMEPDLREALEDLEETHERLQELVNRLLQTSRLELGSVAVKPEPAILQELIEEVVHEMAPLAKENNMTVVRDVPDDPAELPVDHDLLQTTLENLISNAIRYTDKPGEKVRVGLQRVKKGQRIAGRPAPAGGMVITVEDRGMGIAEEEQKMIFQKLYRTKAAKMLKKEGSGLGLATAKKAMEVCGGSLWFASEEGKGSIFALWIPKGGMRSRAGSSLIQRRERRSRDR